jgi:hypothetical protein
MRKQFSLTIVGVFCFLGLFAGKIERAFEALAVFNYFEAKELFEKVKDKEIVAAPYGLSLIYGRDDNPFYNLDSAYHYILMADTNFHKLDEKDRASIQELGLDSIQIENWKDSVDQKVYTQILNSPSVSKWARYIDRHQDAKQIEAATAARDRLAFQYAKEINSSSAYQKYVSTYPNSAYSFEAKNLYEQRLFEEQTSKTSIGSYQNFIKQYPESPFKRKAQDAVYNLATPNKTVEEFHRFIEANPNNPNVEEAWRKLYRLYMTDNKPEKIVQFKIDYPNYPFIDELKTDLKLSLKLFLPFKAKNGKWGFMDTTGSVQLAPQFDMVESFQSGLALAVKQDQVGFVDKQGQVVIPFQYEDAETFAEGLCVVMKDDAYGLINKNNQLVLPFKYDLIGPFNSKLAIVANDTAYGYVNPQGEVVIPLTLDYADDFENTYALIEMDGKKGIINQLGQTVVPMKYAWLENFNQYGIARAKEDSLFGLIDQNGSVLLPFEYDRIGDCSDSLCLIVKEDKYGYVNLKGELTIPLRYDFKLEALSWGVFHAGYAKFHQAGKYGILDSSGKKTFPAIFQDVGEYKPTGLTAVKKRGQWGYSDENLSLKIPYQYDYAISFTQNLGLVKKDGLWKLIDQDGKEALPNEFQTVKPLKESLYEVSHSNKKGLLDLNQLKLIEPAWDRIKWFNTELLQLESQTEVVYYDYKKQLLIKSAQ